MKQNFYVFVFGAAILLALLSFYFLFYHQTSYDGKVFSLEINSMKYDLQQPAARWELPGELMEISGLSYYKNDLLTCVQDEKGRLYFYDLIKKEVVREEKFAKKGDYEGVEIVRDTAYVLKSNGEILFFAIGADSIGEVNKIKTGLQAKNDTEGLGFAAGSNRLLIACKEKAGVGEDKLPKTRAIYSVELRTNQFIPDPAFLLNEKDFMEKLKQNRLPQKNHLPFKPSGIAVHPKTNFIFVIASVGHMLAVLDMKGALIDLLPLDPDILIQPEGICFDPEANLYISSEGKGNNGYIVKFKSLE
ncbi:MAG: hypothetical protein HC819_14635 [Cyclobacteriaceae bacterium]|nr:hypothetical protein [Cyclobacteriaceae bacterium]